MPTSPQASSSRRLPSGWPALDGLLGGGWPVGRLAEVCGPGRTSLGLGAVRTAQAGGLPVAWIDASGSFCPATAEVDLEALSLVRALNLTRASGGRRAPAFFAADVLLRSRAYALVVLDLAASSAPTSVWFRLARLAATAHSSLLLLHAGRRRVGGSAASLVLDVRLAPVSAPPWAELPLPVLEVRLARRRSVPGERGQVCAADTRVRFAADGWSPPAGAASR